MAVVRSTDVADATTRALAGQRPIVTRMELRAAARRDVIRFVDSYASLLVLLLANFFLLELVDDPRWGAIGSTLLAAAALVLFITSTEVLALTYLLPVALLVTATLPVTIRRVLEHRRVTHETVLGALCAYVLR